jgi:hypothetical protein
VKKKVFAFSWRTNQAMMVSHPKISDFGLWIENTK